MSDRVIGLDLGASSVKVAQVLRNGDGTFVVEKQAARALPRGAVYDGRIAPEERLRVADTIRRLIAEEGFSTKDVIVGLNSSASVLMQEISAPLMRPEDVAKAMPDIIAYESPNLTAEDNEIDYTVLGEYDDEGVTKLKVLVYSVRREYAKEVAEVVEEAGLNVVGADLNALATLRAIEIHDRPANQLDAIVDIGANVTILMLHHNGVPKMLSLDPDSAGYVATDKIAETLGIDEREMHKAEFEKINNEDPVGLVAQAKAEYASALAAKIAGGFKNYLDKSVEYDVLANVTLVGGGSLLHGIGYFLHNQLGSVPLSYAHFSSNITGANGDPQRNELDGGGDYLVAVGLGTGRRL